jgi:hypothetical protein
MKGQDLSERFVQKIAEPLDVHNDCWVWTGFKDRCYGQFWANGKPERAHRVSYQLFIGPIPEDRPIDDMCKNRACVRPDHLRPVTTWENSSSSRDKTHCKNGHPLTGDNLTAYSTGKLRVCRVCRNARASKSQRMIRKRKRSLAI